MLFGPINPGLLIQINNGILGKSLFCPVHRERLSQDVTRQQPVVVSPSAAEKPSAAT